MPYDFTLPSEWNIKEQDLHMFDHIEQQYKLPLSRMSFSCIHDNWISRAWSGFKCILASYTHKLLCLIVHYYNFFYSVFATLFLLLFRCVLSIVEGIIDDSQRTFRRVTNKKKGIKHKLNKLEKLVSSDSHSDVHLESLRGARKTWLKIQEAIKVVKWRNFSSFCWTY